MTFPSIRRAMFFAAAAAAIVTLSFAPGTFAQATPEVKRTVLLRHDAPAPGFEAVLVGVEIPVGGREGRHTHPGLAMIHVEDGTLKVDEFAKVMERKPKIAAFGYASNALGTVNPVRKLTKMAKEAGALVYIDAVQYAPHGPIDVQDLGCDFLVCSSYKFFGPHAAALYGKFDLLSELKSYKVRPASNELPYKFETGTQNHEGIAGVLGALEYFEWIGNQFGGEQAEAWKEAGFSGRRLIFKQAMSALKADEFELSRALIETIQSVKGTRIYGLTDMKRLDERVSTVSFTLEGKHPNDVAKQLGDAGFYVWDGHYYALAVVERLGLLDSGGMVRVGAAHYNTLDEVARFGEALRKVK